MGGKLSALYAARRISGRESLNFGYAHLVEVVLNAVLQAGSGDCKVDRRLIVLAGHQRVNQSAAEAVSAADTVNETSYWLKLMYETKRIDLASYKYAEKLCGNIRRLLIASCKTAKENSQ